MAAEAILADYRTVCLTRQMSLAARREVHSSRAKFGTFGDGKEVAQVALNGYRLPEPLTANHGQYTVPLGIPEVLHPDLLCGGRRGWLNETGHDAETQHDNA